jgi:SAM-dependent methyltransferase
VRVYIAAASDTEPDAARRLRWGDYWFKDSLGRALEKLGHTLTGASADAEVLIHLHGYPVQELPDWTYNILWVHSHPDTVHDTTRYDRVFAEGEAFAKSLGCEWLPGASDFEPMDVPWQARAVFVGNAKGHSRSCVDAYLAAHPDGEGLHVWGEGWDWLPKGAWEGLYYPHEDLNALYAASDEVLGDSHSDMEKWGFTNPRDYDVRATRGEVVPTFLDVATRMMEGVRWSVKIDLGCGNHKRAGFVGVDKLPLPGVDYVLDARNGLSIVDGSVDYIAADNLMEHLGAEFIAAMNECHAALRDGGRMFVRVPGMHNIAAAFSDPTHVRFFTPETWDYFNGLSVRWADYGRSYGIVPWQVLRVVQRERFIEVSLRKVAPDG